jgi:tetratricopeptide (TPR) repeat protein
MSSRADRGGLPLSTSSDAAAAHYRDGVDLGLSGWPGAAEAFDQALALDPDFALALAARARTHLIAADYAEARAMIGAAETAVLANGTERERSHVEALARSIRGNPIAALEQVLAHVDRWPRDATILSLPLGAFGLFAFSGMSGHPQAGVDLCERMAPHYGEDWWFLTYLGWAHTENLNLAQGRAITERGFALQPTSAHGLHALAHALFEDGSGAEADALITGWLPDYDRAGILHGHITWHLALTALEAGDTERALALYLDGVQPSASQALAINTVTDGAALLWRLEAYGNAAPKSLWTELSEFGGRAFPSPGLAFVEAHMALIAAATGDGEMMDGRLAKLSGRMADGTYPAGPALNAIWGGVSAFARGDYAACSAALAPMAGDVERVGGSHAQREVFEDTLVLAHLKAGETASARTLLEARLSRRPSVRDRGWLATA